MLKTYSDKLKSPKWQKKRLEILQRDDFTCQLCKSTEKTLHVHHNEYEGYKDPWDYDNKKLITYCDSCHHAVESYKINGFSIFFFDEKILDDYTMYTFGIIDESNIKYFDFHKRNNKTSQSENVRVSNIYLKKLNSLK